MLVHVHFRFLVVFLPLCLSLHQGWKRIYREWDCICLTDTVSEDCYSAFLKSQAPQFFNLIHCATTSALHSPLCWLCIEKSVLGKDRNLQTWVQGINQQKIRSDWQKTANTLVYQKARWAWKPVTPVRTEDCSESGLFRWLVLIRNVYILMDRANGA